VGSAVLIGSLTLLSRILGLVRDQIIAWLLGTGVQADAYGVAIKLPNTFRRLMGEGAMAAAYVPVLSGLLGRADREGAGRREVWRFISRFTYLFTLVLLALTVAGVVLSPWVVRVVAPGFEEGAGGQGVDAFGLTVQLNRVVFPYLFLVCLAALAMGTLNALGSFGPPAFTPVLLNLSIIACALFLKGVAPLPVFAVAVGFLVGGVLQVLWQLPFLHRRGARLRAVAPRPDRHVLQVGRRMGVGAVGAGIYQINTLVGTMVATTLATGSVSALYYADRVDEVVLGVWAVSVATVVLPSLARRYEAGDERGLEETLSLGLRLVFFITLPSAVGLMVLRGPILGTLFLRGEFDLHSLDMTAAALLAYAVGMPAIGGARVMISAFYARGDVARPVSVAGLSFAVNLALLALFYVPLALQGVALAAAGAAWAGWLGLTSWYRLVHGRFEGRRVAVSAVRSAAAAAVMAGVLVALDWAWDPPVSGWAAAGYIALAIPLGAAVYLALSRLLGASEPAEFLNALRRRSSGGKGEAS